MTFSPSMQTLALYAGLLFTPALAAGLLHLGRDTREWFFYLTVVAHLVFFSLRSALATVNSVTRERERGTWDVLCTTLLSRRELYLGRLGQALRPLALPLLLFPSLVLLYPDIPRVAGMLGPLLVLTTVYSLFFASLGLYGSLRSATGPEAARFTYGLLGVIGVLPLLLVLGLEVGAGPTRLGQWVACSPVLTCMSVYLSGSYFGDTQGAWELSALLYGLGALGLIGAGWRMTGRPQRVRSAPGRPLRGWAGAEDPLFYRASCHFSALWSGLRLALLLGGGLVLLGFARSPRAGFDLLALSASVWLALRSLGAGITLVAGERERKTLEVLLATRLSPTQILGSKLRAGLAPVLAELALLLGVLGLAGERAQVPGTAVLTVALVLTATVLFFGCLALWISSRESNVLKAVQKGFLAWTFLALASFWLDAPLADLKITLFSWANPLLAALLPTQTGLHNESWRWIPLVCPALYLGASWVLYERARVNLTA